VDAGFPRRLRAVSQPPAQRAVGAVQRPPRSRAPDAPPLRAGRSALPSSAGARRCETAAPLNTVGRPQRQQTKPPLRPNGKKLLCVC